MHRIHHPKSPTPPRSGSSRSSLTAAARATALAGAPSQRGLRRQHQPDRPAARGRPPRARAGRLPEHVAHLAQRAAPARRLVRARLPGGDESADALLRHGARRRPGGLGVQPRRVLRLGPGDPRPAFTGQVPEFRSALVHAALPARRGVRGDRVPRQERRPSSPARTSTGSRSRASTSRSRSTTRCSIRRRSAARSRRKCCSRSRNIARRSLDLDEVIEAIFKSLRQVVDYDAAAIYLVNRRRRCALELVQRGRAIPSDSDEAFDLQVGAGHRRLGGEDRRAGDRAGRATRPALRRGAPETRSELAAPLSVEGRTIGVFNLESDLDGRLPRGPSRAGDARSPRRPRSRSSARGSRASCSSAGGSRRSWRSRARSRRRSCPSARPMLPGFELAGTTSAARRGGRRLLRLHPRVARRGSGIAIADVSRQGHPGGAASWRASA